MSSAAEKRRATPREYLALERLAENRHEFLNREIIAMAGASRPHNLITHNLNRVIGNQLVNRPCEVYSSDMRVLVEATGDFSYPDVAVVCGRPQFLDAELDTLLNPTVVIEVLSPSTERNDRGPKFARYRRIESLQEYVLIAQDHRLVEQYVRQGERWLFSELKEPDHVLRLASIDCAVTLSEIYAKVSFEEAEKDVL